MLLLFPLAPTRFWATVGRPVAGVKGQNLDVEVRVHTLFGSLLRPSFVGPFPCRAEQGFRPWVPPYPGGGISPTQFNGFVERLMIQGSQRFGLRPLNPVYPPDEIISLPQIDNFQSVISRWNWLITITGERVLIRIPIRLPHYDWFPIAGVGVPHGAVWAERPVADFDNLPAVPTDQWPLRDSNSVIPVWLPHWGQSRLLMVPNTLAPDPMYNFGNFPWSAVLHGDEWHIQPHHLRHWAFPHVLIPGMNITVESELIDPPPQS